jgi:hypothetical protein
MTGKVGALAAALALAGFGLACSDDGDGGQPGGNSGNGPGGATGGGGDAAGATGGASGSGGTMGGGSGGSSGRGGNAGSGGSSGSAGNGGTAGQAGGTGGSSGAGSGGTSSGAHCSPGTLLREQAVWDGKLQLCSGYDPAQNGLPTGGGHISVRNLTIPQPLVAGSTHSISIQVRIAVGQAIELWGTSASCGRADELLFTGTAQPGVVCAELTPTRGHSDLLMVFRGDGSIFISDMTVCMQGQCP